MDERAAFEKATADMFGSVTDPEGPFCKASNGEYLYCEVHDAWKVWQLARASMAVPQPIERLVEHEAKVRRKAEDLHLYRGAHWSADNLYREADAVLRCLAILRGEEVTVPDMEHPVDEEYVALLREGKRKEAYEHLRNRHGITLTSSGSVEPKR